MFGSEANDPILRSQRTASNRSGGVNGGIANGMPVIFRAGFRPVPSIGIEQKSVDLKSGGEASVRTGGRHDCCILPRGCAIVEAAAAVAVFDLLRRC